MEVQLLWSHVQRLAFPFCAFPMDTPHALRYVRVPHKKVTFLPRASPRHRLLEKFPMVPRYVRLPILQMSSKLLQVP